MVVLRVHSKKTINRRKRKKGQHGEGTKRRKGKEKNWNEKSRRKKNEANVRSGRRPSPGDKVAVCWYGQSYDTAN